MSDNRIPPKIPAPRIPATVTRRAALLGGAALTASLFAPKNLRASDFPTAEVNTTGLAVTDDTATVGILHSLTGTMAISEVGSVQATQLAIAQINAQGGILGRQIDFILEDGASDWPTFAQRARKLLVSDRVPAVMGCWTSASRKAVLPIFEQQNGWLYYPTFYEGLEQSPNVIYTGQEATQQILAGLDWVMREKGAESFYLLGSDYIWPRTSNKIARIHLEKNGKRVLGEDYFPLEHTQFNSTINRIRLQRPDVIYAIVVGGSNVAFYRQLQAAGIDPRAESPLVLTISVTEDEVLGIGGENVEGIYSSMKYFQSLENDNNQAFVAAFKEMFGQDSVIGDVTQAAYLGTWLWKAAVERAGSFDVDKVRAATPGIELDTAPEGFVKVHDNHHLWSHSRIGRARADGQFDLIYETAELVEPNPFPEGYQ